MEAENATKSRGHSTCRIRSSADRTVLNVISSPCGR